MSRPGRRAVPLPASWLIVQHAAAEGPGLIAEELRRRGIAMTVCRRYRREALGDPGDFAAVVVLGGSMSTRDGVADDGMAEERAFLEAALDVDRPILGICLGAQLLASATGANVYRGAQEEFGSAQVTLTSDAEGDPVFSGLPRTLSVFQWHEDGFELPDKAVQLATGAPYEQQAFRLGSHAYGLQFHIEADAGWLREVEPSFTAALSLSRAERTLVESTGRTIASRFIDSVLRDTHAYGCPARPAPPRDC